MRGRQPALLWSSTGVGLSLEDKGRHCQEAGEKEHSCHISQSVSYTLKNLNQYNLQSFFLSAGREKGPCHEPGWL